MRWGVGLGVFIGVFFAITLAAATTPKSQPAPGSASPGFVSPLIKVRPGEPVAGKKSATLFAAGNECEGIQLHVPPPARDVVLEVPPLKGPGGELALSVFTVEYIQVQTPSNAEGTTGLWPDPLLPLEAGAPKASSSERPLVYYVRACVPAKQKPGRYTATLRLSAGETKTALPLTLEVHPFSLPATSSLPNTFGLSRYSIAKGHGLSPESPEAHALLAAYAQSLLEHRLSAYGMGVDPPPVKFENGRASIDFRQYDAEMAPFLEGTALASGARFTTTDVRKPSRSLTPEQRVAYFRAFQEHFHARKWKAELFYYAKDEPKPEDYALVLREAEEIRKAGRIRVLVTAPLTPGLTHAADILSPVLNCFFSRAGLSTCDRPSPLSKIRSERKEPRRVYWYQSCMSHGCGVGPMDDAEAEQAFSRWASYMIDHPAPRNRAMGPLAWLTGVDGELYFDTVWRYNEGDPWQSAWAFGGNGDGTLFYPGTPDRTGKHQPVISLRLEHIRDGLEDYEYLRLAEQRGAGKAAKAAVRGWVRSGYDLTLDPAAWEKVRATLTGAIREARE